MASINQRVKTGNRFNIQFDGKNIGVCKSLDMRDDYGVEPVSGIGSINVIEHVPTLARHTLTVEEVVMNTASLLALGIAVENGQDMLNGRVFDITAQDESGMMRKYSGCSYASGSISVRGNAIVVSHATFNAISVSSKMGG